MNAIEFPPQLWVTSQTYGTHVYDLSHEKNALFTKWLHERYQRLEVRGPSRHCIGVKLPKGYQMNQYYFATILDEILYSHSKNMPGKIYVDRIEVRNMEWPTFPADTPHSSQFDYMASFYFCIEPDTMPQSLKGTCVCA